MQEKADQWLSPGSFILVSEICAIISSSLCFSSWTWRSNTHSRVYVAPEGNWKLNKYLVICIKNFNHYWDNVFINRASQEVLVVKNLPANAGDIRDAGSIPGSERSPGWGLDNPLQYSCLENSTDKGAWWETVHGVTNSWTKLKWLSTRACLLIKCNAQNVMMYHGVYGTEIKAFPISEVEHR